MAPASEQPARAGGRSWLLFVSGALLLAAAFLRANPWFGSGRALWPWQIVFEGGDLLIAANWCLWLTGGVLALVWGWRGCAGVRPALLAGLALVLLFTCHGGTAGLHVRAQSLPWLLGTALMLVGFVQGGESRATPTSRLLTGLGAMAALWAMGGSFEYAEEGITRAQLHQLLRDIGTRVTEGTVEQFDLNRDDALWAYGSLLVGCIIALLHWAGVRVRLLCGLGAVAVLLCYLIPTFSGIGRALPAPGGLSAVPSYLSELLIDAGLGLALFCTAAGTALLRPTEEAA